MDIVRSLKDRKSIAYIGIILAVGIFLMSGKGKTTVRTEPTKQQDISHRLEKILSEVEGAGDVKVLISYSSSGEKILAYDSEEEKRAENGRDETNIKSRVVYDGSRAPFVLAEYMPEAEGVIIAAQGADDENVKNQLIKGTMALLGIDEHKIEVLKMK